MFDYQATLIGIVGAKLPPARITFPDGTSLDTERADISQALSAALKREVGLETVGAVCQRRSKTQVPQFQ